VQFFSDDYLERCRAMKPAEVLDFLESFRLLHARAPSGSRLISLKVPEHLLGAFRGRCRLEGVRYQTQIKRLMSAWLRAADGAQAGVDEEDDRSGVDRTLTPGRRSGV
jgi:predicted DNA binding CopG/RHH family protein